MSVVTKNTAFIRYLKDLRVSINCIDDLRRFESELQEIARIIDTDDDVLMNATDPRAGAVEDV